ncbi:hypothetical protein ACLBWX_18630 [Methylobacterium sp. M6A4_1b]
MDDGQPRFSSVATVVGSAATAESGSRKRRFGRRVLKEARRTLGIFLYLWMIFSLLILHEQMVLSRHGLSYGFFGLAFFNAWVLAKIMLVAESLDVRPDFSGRPLLYPILVRSCVFAAILVGAYAVEDMLIGLWRGKSIVDSVPAIGGGGFRGPASAGIIMAVALIPYFAFRELGRVIGRERVHALLFRGVPPADMRGGNGPRDIAPADDP